MKKSPRAQKNNFEFRRWFYASVFTLLAMVLSVSCSKKQLETEIPVIDGWQFHKKETYKKAVGYEYRNDDTKITFPKKAPKRLLLFSGTPYEMGVVMGKFGGAGLAGAEASIKNMMAHSLPSHFSKKDIDIIFDFLENAVVNVWNDQMTKGNFPSWFSEEIDGIFMGAQMAVEGTSHKVTMGDIILPNYLAEVVMCMTLTGDFMPLFLAWAEEQGHLNQVANYRLEHFGGLWHSITPLCDGFAVKDEALADGGVLVARSLQAGSKGWAESVSYIIRRPVTGDQPYQGTYLGKKHALYPTLSIGVLGQVGALTCMNSEGFASGTQTLRSSAGSIDALGLGSALLCRYSADVGGDTDQAVAAVRGAVRGMPYVHIMGDPGGNIVAAEIIGTKQGRPDKTPYQYLRDFNPWPVNELLERLIPRENFKDRFPEGGVFPRPPGYENPAWLAEVDMALFKALRHPIKEEQITDPTGMIWSNYKEELRPGQVLIGPFFFPPARAWADEDKNKNKIVSTNFALNPEIVLSGMTMNSWLSGMSSEAPQWRFDTVNRQLAKHYGSITVDTWKGDARKGTGMQYISPWAVPDYPLNIRGTKGKTPAQYGEVHVSGSLAIMDLPAHTMHAKFGYWGDGWTQVRFKEWLKILAP